ncbi:MAG TPA: hypothetical protein VL992_09295 [Tepidisphaeraceae bacterium]|nr:hypothetical protein [Tepidisphaeraceae bacterium]
MPVQRTGVSQIAQTAPSRRPDRRESSRNTPMGRPMISHNTMATGPKMDQKKSSGGA